MEQSTPRAEDEPASSGPLTASPLQQSMLNASLSGSPPRPYVQQFRWRMSRNVDPGRFQRAVRIAFGRHEVFRHQFVRDPAGKFRIRIGPRLRVRFRFRDWSGQGDAHLRVARFLSADRARGFPNASGILCRVSLIRLGERTHEFVWTSHHALFDGRSRWVILRDLLSCLKTAGMGVRPTAPAASVFSRHLLWLRDQDAARTALYWRAKLRGLAAPTPLDFALRFKPRGTATPKPEQIGLRFGSSAERPVRRFLRQGKFSLNMVGQAAWGLLLSRTSGQSKVCFGSPRAGRKSGVEGAAEAVGLFMNTLPVVLTLDPGRRVRDLLSQVRRQWTGLRAIESSPAALARTAAPFGPDAPLFESLFGCEDYQIGERMKSAGWADPKDQIELRAHTDVPFVLQLHDGPRLCVESVFDADRFARRGVEHVLRSFEWIVRQMAERPNAPLDEITLIGGREKSKVMRAGRGPGRRGGQASVPALFGRWARGSPGRTALRDGGRELTYGELNGQADRLARAIIDRGVRPGDFVGLYLDRSVEFAVGALAILKAGAAYVPLDLEYPAERIRWILRDAKPRLTLCTAEGRKRIGSLGSSFATIESLLIGDRPGRGTDLARAPEAPACVLYTSGSTGTPKGVLVTHRGIARLVHGADYLKFGPSTRTLFHSAVSFDASTFELWAALLNGGACTVCPGSALDLQATRALIQRDRINVLWLTASLFNLIVDEAPTLLAGVRHVLAGGEALSPAHVRRFYARNARSAVINGYGPTENTTFSCCYEIPRTHPDAEPVPIGRSIAGSFAFVADTEGHAVPPGVPGELWVGGAGVALGYWNAPELTRRSFPKDPSSSDPRARLYRTGDRVVLRYDGLFEFLGRADQQVKIRGCRIEPEEVRRALQRLDGVKATAVVALDEPGTGLALHAFVVPGDPRACDPAKLAEALRARLPSFLVPGHFHAVAALPATARGKIDQGALRAWAAKRRPAESAPGSAGGTQKRLLRIWRHDLGLRPRHARESFFAIGGNSLLAARLLHRVNCVFGTAISLDRMQDADTVESMARLLESEARPAPSVPARARTEAESPRFVLRRRSPDRPRPISPQWRRHQFEARLGSGANTTTICRAFRISGRLDAERLESALTRLVRAHEALRTYLEDRGGSSWERIWTVAGPLVQRIDLSGRPAAEAWAAARSLFGEESVRVVSLYRPPLFAFKLVRLAPADHLLILNFHHALVDGISLNILYGQLAELYAEPARARPAFRRSKFTCRDFSDSLERWFRRGALRSLERYWAPAMRDLPLVRLPFEREVPLPVPQPGRREIRAIPAGLSARVDAACAGIGLSRFVFFLTALKVLIYRQTGCRDFPIVSAVMVRMTPETEDIIGDVTNNVVLRTRLDPGESFRSLGRRVAATVMGALAHRAYPMMELRQWCPACGDFGRDRLRQMTFHSALDSVDCPRLGAAEVTVVPREQSLAYIRLHFILGRTAEGVALTAVYPESAVDLRGLRRFLDAYCALLAFFSAHPTGAVRAPPPVTGTRFRRAAG